MHKILWALLLAIASGNAIADWVLLGTDGDENTSVYADPSSFSKNGDMVKMESMIDFKKAVKLSDEKQFLSWKTQNEFDCKSRRHRIFAATMHVQNMGEGEITNRLDFESPDWEEVPSESNGEVLWVFACRNGYQREVDAQKHCPKDTVVWLNLTSGAIHHKGQHWYGRTQSGAYVCKSETVQAQK